MKSKTRLDSAVFQLTPTRTRCDLYIIANDKKEKIASGLLNPFIAHLKTAQDQIAEGGYSVLLQPDANSNATWFTKCTVESFVRFVSTPEILERVYTIESEILQIEEAIAIQGNSDIMVEEQHVKPLTITEGNKHTHDADEDKAIVLYKPGGHETSSSSKEGNSKVQLLNVLETRKTVLKKEQGMAFARAVAAGFEIDHVTNLLSFSECFGASRLMSACLRYMDLWKQKHESGQWVEIEEEDAISNKLDYSAMNGSEIVLSSHNNEIKSEPTTPETKVKTSSDPNSGGQQQYHTGQFPHPVFPPWAMQTSPGGVPVYPAYHMQGLSPYYQHYPGNGPFYPPPYPPMEDPHRNEQKRQSMDNSESVNQERKSGKMKSGRVVIRNINFINSKKQDSSEDDESASDTDTETKETLKSPKRKGNKESDSDNGHWDAFQSLLLKGAAEGGGGGEDMFGMERNSQKKRQQKTIGGGGDDKLMYGGHNGNIQGGKIDMQSYERNGRKIVYRNGNDDFMVSGREEGNGRNLLDPLADSGVDNRNGIGLRGNNDDSMLVSIRSNYGNDNRSSINMDYEFPSSSQNQEIKVNYEPHDLSLMKERSLENRSIGYDPAFDYEMQVAENGGSREKKTSDVSKKGSKSTDKGSKVVGPVRKGRPSKVSNTLEDARARAEKLRSYKADLQKMKKEQQDAELKRLEALKIERQKRIAARANSNSISTRKSLPSKLSPMAHKPSKFTDSEPGSSSPLQRSKIRPTSIGSTDSKKPSTTTKLINGNHTTVNRMTRSMSSVSDTKKEVNSNTPDSKASFTRIRRLSEPKKINNTRINTTTTSLKTKSAESISKTKLPNKISAIVSLDQSKAASLPELKIKTSKVSSSLSEKFSKVKEDKSVLNSGVAKVNLNESDENPVIDKSVVMLEHKHLEVTSRVNKGFEEDCAGIRKVEVVDKGTISIQPSSCEVRKNTEMVESSGEKSYQAPYARVSSFEDPSTRNSEYAKAPQTNFGGGGNEKAYISDFNNLKLEKIPEAIEKPQVKEAKGFRKLLKFGKKSHTSSDIPHPDNVASSDGVHTLKTLIAEDQAPTHAQKSSRHFSLLSSFRGEKKATP